MKTRTLIVALGLSVSGHVAHAACEPEAPADGAEVTCTDIDTDGFVFEDLDDINLSVVTNAIVQNSGVAIAVDDGLTLDNLGTIESTDDHAVEVDKDLVLTNSGNIVASSSDGKDAIKAADDAVIDNGGLISATDDAIDTEGFDNVSITNVGRIEAGDKGLVVGPDDDDLGGAGLTLLNTVTGEIDTVDEAVETGDDADITNAGFIQSLEDDAIQLGQDGLIENAATGQILSEGGDGIDIDSGEIINHGVIATTAAEEAGIDVDEGTDGSVIVTNTGTISGSTGVLSDPENTESQQITNSGSVIGFDGLAFDLGQGADLVTLLDGSMIDGGAMFGSGLDRLEILGFDLDLSAAGPFDGGDDTDVFALDLSTSSLTALLFDDATGMLDLSFDGGFGSTRISLMNFESFVFSDATYALDELVELQPVPLPAAGLMLLVGLAGFGAVRRPQRA